MTAPDARTVQFRLKDVYVPFEAAIGAPLFWILPREVIEAGGLLTDERGSPLFPLDPDRYHGEPIALLAGDPLAHDQARRDVLALA